MGLDWSKVEAEHVSSACTLLVHGKVKSAAREKGLFVIFDGHRLSAKQVAKLAYCIANRLPLESAVKFASGEGTLKRLEVLGAKVERVPAKDSKVSAGG
jgi:hypothetical protein